MAAKHKRNRFRGPQIVRQTLECKESSCTKPYTKLVGGHEYGKKSRDRQWFNMKCVVGIQCLETISKCDVLYFEIASN